MSTLEATDTEIADLEKEIFDAKRKLAALRKERPEEIVEEFTLIDSFGTPVQLSSLFGSKDTLMVIHNMGPSCSYCTLWADGINGVLAHLEKRATVVLESPVDPAEQRTFAMDRGWKYQCVSSQGSDFRAAMGFVSKEDGSPWPGVSMFKKNEAGQVVRFSKAEFGPGDLYNIVWDFFDLMPSGWSDWGEDEGIAYYYSETK